MNMRPHATAPTLPPAPTTSALVGVMRDGDATLAAANATSEARIRQLNHKVEFLKAFLAAEAQTKDALEAANVAASRAANPGLTEVNSPSSACTRKGLSRSPTVHSGDHLHPPDAASESDESESDDELAVLNARCVRLEAEKQQLQQRVRYLETLAKIRNTSDECPFRLEVWMPPGWETAPSGHKFPPVKGTVGTFPHQVREMAPTTGEEGASTQRVYLIEEQRK